MNLSAIKSKLYLRFFGNTLSLKVNFIYFLHHKLSSWRSNGRGWDKDARNLAEEFKSQGFTKIDGTDVKELAQAVNDYFKTHPPENGVGVMDHKAAAQLAPLLFKIISQKVEQVLNNYYGSHFQLYWGVIQRYDGRGQNNSFLFHTDDVPAPMVKILYYLTDTVESNAAFRCFDLSMTKKLFKRGFLSYSEKLRGESQSLVTNEMISRDLKIIEGPQGTALLFDNNLIHRAELPRQGYRDSVTIEVYPAPRRFEVKSVEQALLSSRAKDYPANPFYNDSQVALQ